MLLPTRMKRVEIIVPQRKSDEVMLSLREQNAVELLDVKEIIKGYGGGVTPTTGSDRLYRSTTLESKLNTVISALGIDSKKRRQVIVEPRSSDEELSGIEKRVNEIEQRVTLKAPGSSSLSQSFATQKRLASRHHHRRSERFEDR